MALNDNEQNFLFRNFPGNAPISPAAVRDAAARAGLNLSREFETLLSEQPATFRPADLVDPAAPSIDLSDIPLQLDNVDPQSQATNQPAPPAIDPELAQYDDLYSSGQVDFGADDFDPGFDPGIDLQPPPVETMPEYPEELQQQAGQGPDVPDGDVASTDRVYESFGQFSDKVDLESLDDNEGWGTGDDFKTHFADRVYSGEFKFTPLSEPYHGYLKADEMVERLSVQSQALGYPDASIGLTRKQVNGIRYLGKGFAAIASFSKKVDEDFYKAENYDLAEELFTNLKERKQPSQNSENTMAAQEESENVAANDTIGGRKTDERELGEGALSKSPAVAAVEALQHLHDNNPDAEVLYEVIQGQFERHGVPIDAPVYEKLQEEARENKTIFKLSDLMNYALRNPEPKQPSSQPTQSDNEPQSAKSEAEADKKKEKELERDNGRQMTGQGHTLDLGKPIAALGKGLEKGAAMTGMAVAATGKAALGGVRNIAGFIKANNEAKMQYASDVNSSIDSLSSQLDGIAATRQQMKGASNMFERKQFADQLTPQLSDLERSANALSEKVADPKAKWGIKKGNVASRMEALESKMEATFDGMEPGKGEKKAFDQLKQNIDAAMEAVKQMFNAVKRILTGGTLGAEPKAPSGPVM